MFSPMAVVEAFHLAFLRAFAGSAPTESFCVKGGCNLRFFFGSDRYSEDLDLDLTDLPVHQVRDKVLSILESGGLNATARTYGVAHVRPPNISRAKQTETVQRFKVHLITTSGEDLPTKIELSRRGMDSPIRTEVVRPEVLEAYRMPALILPHYSAAAAARQKIRALVSRRVTQARDVFDIHVLSTQPELRSLDLRGEFSKSELRTALANTYSVEYEQFRDAVVAFLSPEHQERYASKARWDEIRLVTVALIEKALENGG